MNRFMTLFLFAFGLAACTTLAGKTSSESYDTDGTAKTQDTDGISALDTDGALRDTDGFDKK